MKKLVVLFASACSIAACGDKNPSSPKAVENVVSASPAPAPAPAPLPAPTKWDGPLGVKMGLTLADLEKAGLPLKQLQPGIYSSTTAPASNSKFESYTFLIGEKTGLCKVVGIGHDIVANAFGTQLKAVFDDLEPALTAKYGKPTDSFKFVRAGSLWTEDQYWMMGLSKEERSHSVMWFDGSKGITLPGIHAIALKAYAANSGKGYVTLSYEFPNIKECQSANKEKDNSSL